MRLINITPDDKRFYDLEDLPNEEWKPVVECPDCYICSNYSRIKTLPRNGVKKGGRILKPTLKKDGYYQVVMNVYGKHLYRRVNRIIAQSFISNPDNKPICDHIDNNPKNNFSINLQWLTPSENTKKYLDEVYDGRYIGRGKIKPKKVKVLNDDNVVIGIYNSLTECSKVIFNNKGKRGGISKACKNHKKYLGLYFEYIEGGDE